MAEAVERLGQAVRDGWGAGYDASVVRGLSKSTLDGYLGALAKLRRRERMQLGCDRRRVLEDELGDIAAQDVGEGNIKKLLSGVRLPEKLGWIKSTVRPGVCPSKSDMGDLELTPDPAWPHPQRRPRLHPRRRCACPVLKQGDGSPSLEVPSRRRLVVYFRHCRRLPPPPPQSMMSRTGSPRPWSLAAPNLRNEC